MVLTEGWMTWCDYVADAELVTSIRTDFVVGFGLYFFF